MSTICFDLDGTLVDPLPGISHCMREICAAFGLTCPTEAEIRPFIGPSVRGLMSRISGAEEGSDRLRELMARYWEVFSEEGVFEHRVYEGVQLMLGRLKRQDHRIFAVTAKPAPYARRVAHHLDLNLVIDDIFGPAPDQAWPGKLAFMESVCQGGALCTGGYMVGDRGEDMKAGLAFDLIPLGVTWGYGSREELEASGARHLFDDIPALDDWFRQELPAPETRDLVARAE